MCIPLLNRLPTIGTWFAASMYFFFRSRCHAVVFTTATCVRFAIALSLFRTGASAWSVQLKSGMQACYQIGRRFAFASPIAPKSTVHDLISARTDLAGVDPTGSCQALNTSLSRSQPSAEIRAHSRCLWRRADALVRRPGHLETNLLQIRSGACTGFPIAWKRIFPRSSISHCEIASGNPGLR